MERAQSAELITDPETVDEELAELSEEELLIRLMTHLRELDPLHDLASSATALAELTVAETAADGWRTFDQVEREAAERMTVRRQPTGEVEEAEESTTSPVADPKKPR